MIETKTCGVVLSGGKSTRMGKDKGLTLYRGRPLISHVLSLLSGKVDSICISTGNAEYRIFGYPLIKDVIPDIGPMGGIYSALKQVPADGYLFTACDIPELTAGVITQMLNVSQTADIVFLKTESGMPQPLPLYLGLKVLSLIQIMVSGQKYKLQDIITEATHNPEFKLAYVLLADELKNINSPKDLE